MNKFLDRVELDLATGGVSNCDCSSPNRVFGNCNVQNRFQLRLKLLHFACETVVPNLPRFVKPTYS